VLKEGFETIDAAKAARLVEAGAVVGAGRAVA